MPRGSNLTCSLGSVDWTRIDSVLLSCRSFEVKKALCFHRAAKPRHNQSSNGRSALQTLRLGIPTIRASRLILSALPQRKRHRLTLTIDCLTMLTVTLAWKLRLRSICRNMNGICGLGWGKINGSGVSDGDGVRLRGIAGDPLTHGNGCTC